MDYYLYSHSNADGIFYIGKGCGDRVREKHLALRSAEWSEASKDGYTYKIEANGTEADILLLEKSIIKSLIKQGVNLVNKMHNPNSNFRVGIKNHRFGKTGTKSHMFGRVPSDEAKEKMSISTSGKNNPMFGQKRTDEDIKSISIGRKKAWQHTKLAKANAYTRRRA